MSKQKKEDCVYLEYATADANIASKTFCTLQHANEVVKKKNPLACDVKRFLLSDWRKTHYKHYCVPKETHPTHFPAPLKSNGNKSPRLISLFILAALY